MIDLPYRGITDPAQAAATKRLDDIRYRMISLNAGDVPQWMKDEEKAAYAAYKEARK